MSKRLRSLFPPSETLEGYEHAELVEVIFQKTKAYKPVGDWPEMKDVSTVLDFGGGCGLHYRLAVQQSPEVRWAVIETPAMASRASELATDKLCFFTDIDTAVKWIGEIDVMHSNGALQYTPDPELTLRRLVGLGAKVMLWERTFLGEPGSEIQVLRLGDNGPGAAPRRTGRKAVSVTRTRISEPLFLACHENYIPVDRGKDTFKFERAFRRQ